MSEAKADPAKNTLSEDKRHRESLVVGSKCLIYSELNNAWVRGKIMDIFTDEEGQWLNVRYIIKNTIYSKQIQRFHEGIKPIQASNEDQKDESKDEDILALIKREKGTLFDRKQRDFDSQTQSIERIKFILKIYNIWISNHENKKHLSGNNFMLFDEIIGNALDSNYSFIQFMIDYRIVTEIKKDLFETEKNICNAQMCKIIDRNTRDRMFYANNNRELMDLYYIKSNNESDSHSVTTQQMIDSLHTYVYHTLYIKDLNEKIIENGSESKTADNDTFNCDDLYVTQLCETIAREQNKSSRFRERTESKDSDIKYNKFQTTNTSKFMKIVSNAKQKCFLDIMFLEMNKYELDLSISNAMNTFIFENEYDTESIILDLKNTQKTDSNLKLFLNISAKMYKIMNRLFIEDSIRQSLYSAGVRYFYWEYYKNNMNERSAVMSNRRTFYDENVGYKLCEWYVGGKYANLKEELTNNLICTFSLSQFQTTVTKATQKLEAWLKDPNAPKLKCKWANWPWAEKYGIKESDPITLQHIVSVLCYCNFSKQCYCFGETFRKLHKYESDNDMRMRNREYAIWARLLRETVECYGTTMQKSKIPYFYHGVSSTLIFDSTDIKLFGPTSTSADFQIATSIFGADGIVIDFMNEGQVLPYFDCRWWSDFHSEDEKLFFGGLQAFGFKTIRNMQTTPKQNYGIFVQALSMFHYMIEAWPWPAGKITKKHFKALKLMVNEEMAHNILKGMPSKTPMYMLQLWHHFLWKIKSVEINWDMANKGTFNNGPSEERDGFTQFSSLFYTSDCTSLDFCSLLHILPNLESIDIYTGRKKTTVELTESFLPMALSAVSFVNNTPSLKSSFKTFNIWRPKTNISEFINTNNKAFLKHGWTLRRTVGQSVYHQTYPKCNDTLSIQKL